MLELQLQAIRRYRNPLTLIFLAVICYVLFFHGLGNIGFLGPDEPRYPRSRVKCSEVETSSRPGSTVHHGLKSLFSCTGEPRSDSRYSVSGNLEPVCLLHSRRPFASTVCISQAGLWDQSTALLATLVMASSIGFFTFSRAASMDMLLTASLTTALCSFLVASNAEGAVHAGGFTRLRVAWIWSTRKGPHRLCASGRRRCLDIWSFAADCRMEDMASHGRRGSRLRSWRPGISPARGSMGARFCGSSS